MTGPDHHAEMEAHYAAGRERQDEDHLREITRWLADQMCRMEEPLIGQFANSLSVEGAKRLNALMSAAQPSASAAVVGQPMLVWNSKTKGWHVLGEDGTRFELVRGMT